MPKITKIRAREILDSRGNPTVEAMVALEDGVRATAAVPSGASTGAQEAVELRDGDSNRYGGKGVLNAVANVNGEIAESVVGMDAAFQRVIDEKMIALDGTNNKSRLGANAILAVSLAVCRAAATASDMSLYRYISQISNLPASPAGGKYHIPVPMFNILNGGAHADSGLCIQEFKVVPKGVAGFSDELRAGSEIFHALKKRLSGEGYATSVGDEGGFAPHLASNEEALRIIGEAIAAAGYEFGKEVYIALDTAANFFWNESEKAYILQPEAKSLSRENLITAYGQWAKKYHIISIEDGLHEEDWGGWREMNEKLGRDMMLIGDDLLVTNVERLKKAINEKSCNAVLIKPNQIGTLTETIACMELAKKNDMKTVVSHRSGETTDTFIADLAVGAGADFIKTGAPSRGERVCKYNRLAEIEEDLGE